MKPNQKFKIQTMFMLNFYQYLVLLLLHNVSDTYCCGKKESYPFPIIFG